MTVRLRPYLAFPGNGAEVMNYYAQVFGGSLDVMKYGDTPMELPFTPPTGALAHAHLDSSGVQITGGDAVGNDADADANTNEPLASDIYSFLLEFDSTEEATALIEKFTTSGGAVEMPFQRAPWGDHYGQVKDKYGVLWAFSVAGAEG